jgi:mannosyltransferase
VSTRASTHVLKSGPRALAWSSSVWLGLIVGMGAILRLINLDRQSLWLDEGISYWIALRPLSELVGHLATGDTHPPLHYLLLKGAIALGGSEWLLRFPSVLAGLVGIGLLYALGRELFDARTGLVAALIVAVSPLHIWHSQEARMYALVATLTLAAGLFAARALRTNSWLDWGLLVACQALALYTNTAAIWFTLALNGAALLLVGRLWQRGQF